MLKSFLLALLLCSLGLTTELYGLVISEIHYRPPVGQENLEFIEVSNDAPSPDDISGFSFVDGVFFEFPPGTVLDAGGVLVICADADAVRTAYGIDNVVGSYEGNLDGAGERLAVVNHAGRVIQSVRYNDQGKWPVGPDGTGHTLAIKKIYLDPSEPESWTHSPELGGSPGRPNFPEPSEEPGEPVEVAPEFRGRFNELLRGDGSDDGWVEFFNEGTTTLDLGGLAVTEDPARPDPYIIPDGTTLEPKEFLVLSESDTSLDLSTPKVQLFLLDRDGLVLNATAFDHVPPQNSPLEEYSEARYPDGAEVSWVTAEPTPGAANVVPRVTDIVINEIFYHPPEFRTGEFIELYHRGADGAVDLSNFRFNKGIDYTFPEGTSLAPGEYLVLSDDPEVLRKHYGLEGVLQYQGVLANGGENIRLVDRLGNLVDEVRYWDGGRWSLWADGRGSSLELIDPAQDNDIASAWEASDESEKSAWEKLSYRVERYTPTAESELHVLMVERGICHIDDVSVARPLFDASSLLDVGAEWRFRKGTGPFSDPPSAWIDAEFDDGDWLIGRSGFGYGVGEVNTVLDDMQGNYTSIAARTTFQLTQEFLDGPEAIFFGISFDDGFCAFLNGVELDGENCPQAVSWNATATAAQGLIAGEKTIEIPKDLLVVGENQLAIAAFNSIVTSNDFLLAPRVAVLAGGGPNTIPNPGFEEDTEPWLIEGTHIHSQRITSDSHSGDACLELVATGKGDSLCNRIETDTSPPLELADYVISLWARWQRGSNLLILHGEFAPGPSEWRGSRSDNLANNSLGGRLRMTVPWNLGTPGEENSARTRLRSETGSDNLGPVITDVSHRPFSPDPEEEVHVVARVADADGVAAVRVFVKDSRDTGEFLERELFDDGVHGDGDPGDGVYGGQMPGFPTLKRVIFFVEAEDTRQAVRRFPPEAPEKTLVYLVEGRVSETVQVVIDNSGRSALSRRRLHSNDLVDGTLVYKNDAAYYGIGLRYRGSAWGRPAKQSYRVRFPKDQAFHRGRKEVNLSNRDTNDGVWNALITRNSTWETPTPAFDYHYATTRVDGRLIGASPGMFETADRAFLEKWYGRDAVENMVCLKANGRQKFDDSCQITAWDEATLRHMEPSTENFRFYWNHAIHQSRDNWVPWFQLTEVMDPIHTSNEDFARDVFDVVDVEQFLRVLGPRILMGDQDALFVGNGHNGYSVWTPERGWGLLPFDMGFSSGTIAPLTTVRDVSVARMLNSAPVLRIHYRLLLEYVNGYWSDLAWPFLDALENSTAERGAEFKTGISSGSASVKRQLEPFVDVEFVITTNGGSDFETADISVELQGRAGIQIANVLVSVNDSALRPIDLAWGPGSEVTRWTGTVDLLAAVNAIELFGFDAAGNLLDTAQITVVTSGSPTPPFIRGDARRDDTVDITDAVAVLRHLFLGGSLRCRDAADVNDDGSLEITDAVVLLEYLFRGGVQPKPPFPKSGRDPSDDALNCEG